MVRIRYLFVRIRLRLAGQRALAAKDRLTAAVQDSHDTTQLLDRRYRQFLSLATKREKWPLSVNGCSACGIKATARSFVSGSKQEKPTFLRRLNRC